MIARIQAILIYEASKFWTYFIAIVISGIFVACFFPLHFLMGNSIIFDPNTHDNSLHAASWWFYLRDTWRFPLLWTERANFPVGQSVIFSDGIPIAALFFKAIIALFPHLFTAHFHYFGYWFGLAFFLQGIAAVILIRALGAKSLFAAFIAMAFALTWPVLHIRYSHTALMMQSIILFSLALYFLGRNECWSSTKVVTAYIALNLIALTVHPYFAPITFALYVAYLSDQVVRLKTAGWAQQFLRIFYLLFGFGVVGFLFGYFQQGAGAIGGGYGNIFSFDLLSPFCGNTKWSQCAYLKQADLGVQFEGYNYFGIGFIFILVFTMLLYGKSMLSIFRNYPSLTFLIFCIFIYAATNQIHFGNLVIFQYTLPSWLYWLTGTFRAAGRFFWVIGYLILFATLATVLKQKNWISNIIIFAGLTLQIVDIKPAITAARKAIIKPSLYDYETWSPVLSEVDQVNIYPVLGCSDSDYDHVNVWAIYQIAGYFGKLINSGYSARDFNTCALNKLPETFVDRQLYLIGNPKNEFQQTGKSLPAPYLAAINRGECVRLLDGVVCLPKSSAEFWQNLRLKSSPIQHLPQGRRWFASELQTRIGRILGVGSEQLLIPTNANTAGWLSFGPYIALPAGTYRFAITFSSKASHSQQTGNWDVVVQMGDAGGEKILSTGKLMGTNGELKRIEGVLIIDTTTADKPIEARTFFLAQGDLQMSSFELQKIQASLQYSPPTTLESAPR